MSFEPDNIEHEVSIEELLRQIIIKLDIIIMHNEQITDEKFKQEDLDNDN
jgi:hypothetical protein